MRFDKIEYISKNEAWDNIQDTVYNSRDIDALYGKEGIFLSGG